MKTPLTPYQALKKSRGRCIERFCHKKIGNKSGPRCEKHKRILFIQKHPIAYAYSALRGRARYKKIHFDLTLDEFKEFCEKTGYTEKMGRNKGNLHIDRIDPKLGYTRSNIQALTCSENSAKGWHERGRGYHSPVINGPF